jgi:quinone-modifying oxidoreductase subunit QmoC
MSVRVATNVARQLEKYGVDSANECFNCGNCTAVCSITEDDTAFPRMFIRYMQLGLTDRMMECPEPWMCYYCGDCSETCPREAEPGKLMGAARRWLVGQYDITGLARIFSTNAPLSIIIMAVFAVIIGAFLMTGSGAMQRNEIAFWQYLNPVVVHNVGLTIIILVVIAGVLGVINMGRLLARDAKRRREMGIGGSASANGAGSAWFMSGLRTLFLQVLGHERYVTCDEEKEEPWYLKAWFLHGCAIWGFLGLLLATVTHWVLELAGLKETGQWIPMYSVPIRTLGIIAGAFLIYGTTILIINRLTKHDKMSEHSYPSDWIFLILLWIAGVTGWLTLLGEYLKPPEMWTYYMLFVHVVLSMELVLLVPFTKFAHVFYRTVAVFIEEQRKAARAAR